MFLTIITASLLLITRNWQDWGELALPVMVGWKYFGMPIPTVFLVIGTITFVISILSMKVITGALSSTGDKLIEWRMKGRTGRQMQRINVREGMEKLRLGVAMKTPIEKRTMQDNIRILDYNAKELDNEEKKIIKEIEKEKLKEATRKRMKEKEEKIINTRVRYVE